jgi:DNA primase
MVVRIEQSFLEKLKERYDLVEVVREHVSDLRQGGGGEWVGKCPLHDDKTASCTVNRLRFHCFGCHAHLDIFGWVQRMSGLTFPQAVKSLSNGAVPLVRGEDIKPRSIPTHSPYDAVAVERIVDVNEAAYGYFLDSTSLMDDDAKAYYYKRFGIIGAVIGVGYAPDVKNGLINYIKADPEHLREAGLASQSNDGSWYDRLRDRIVIPLRSPGGHIVGFLGRIIPRLKNEKLPKYVNPPTSWAFSKSRFLFNVKKKRKAVIVTEGALDAITTGHLNPSVDVVATLGCKLSSQQFDLLRHYYEQIFMMYDGDNAGREGILQALEMSRQEECDMRVIILPDGQDPDSFGDLGLPLKSLPIVRAGDFCSEDIVLGVTVDKKIKYDRGILDELSKPYRLDNMRNGWAHYNVVDWVMQAYPQYAAEIKEATLEMVRDTDVKPDGTHCFKVERVKAFLRAWMKPSREVRKLHGKD